MNKIRETIVVEGRDDTIAIRQSVDAITIETHGFGIRPQTWDLIEKAYKTTGIIVFTDPDHAGDQIRRRVMERFPEAKEAFLDREKAEKKGDIGIENASPESIREALAKAHCTSSDAADGFAMEDLVAWGLAGGPGSSQKRREIGDALGIGFANSKTFLQRLNRFGITRKEIEEWIYTHQQP